MGKNIYSVGRCTSQGMKLNFKGDLVNFIREGTRSVVAVSLKQENLIYRMFLQIVTDTMQEANAAAPSIKTWHQRMGHINL